MAECSREKDAAIEEVGHFTGFAETRGDRLSGKLFCWVLMRITDGIQ